MGKFDEEFENIKTNKKSIIKKVGLLKNPTLFLIALF